jgi:hypothetical protein
MQGLMMPTIDAEMTEIRDVYPRFDNVAAPFSSQEDEAAMLEVGQLLHKKGGAHLVGQTLLELSQGGEFSEEFVSYLATIWPAH